LDGTRKTNALHKRFASVFRSADHQGGFDEVSDDPDEEDFAEENMGALYVPGALGGMKQLDILGGKDKIAFPLSTPDWFVSG
jgi:hypothetical protein